MAADKDETQTTGGMLIDGVAGSEAVDSSGEVLSIKGADISELEEGRGLFCYEHKGHDGDSNGQEIVGKILSAKKIYKASDCETDRQKLFWDKVRLPYIYITGRFYDAAGHEGSKALAAAIRDHIANNEPVILGFSVEGSTIKKDGNVLELTAIRRVAVTNKPCNKTVALGVLADPQAPAGFDKYPEGRPDLAGMARKAEDPMMMRLGGSEVEYSVDMLKAMTAGSYAGAPGTLTGGAALQVEDRGLGARALKAFGAWDRKKPIREFLKAQLPEISDDFLNHFSELVENHLTRVKKTVEVVMDLAKSGKAPKKQAESPGLEKDPSLTVLGKPVKPNPKLKAPKFDEKTGTLHTPKGSFKVYIPGKDSPEAKASFDKLMQDPKISLFHDYAMENWSKAHKLLKAGQLPPEVAMHSVLFSNLSPNCLDAETEALTQRGWVKGFDLRHGDTLLTKNAETGCLEWQVPTDLRMFPDYEGPMVEFKSRSFYALTTPDHEWLVTTQRGHQRIKKSTEISFGADRIHRTGDYVGPETSGLTPDEAEILGWFVTDGYYSRASACNNSHNSKYEVSGVYAHICQSTVGNPEKCARIGALLERTAGPEVSSHIGKDGKQAWTLGPYLTKIMLARAPERCLTIKALLDLDRQALDRLREAMVLGDGWSDHQRDEWTPRECLCTGRQEQAEAFQVLLTMTGNASSMIWRDMSMYEPHSAKMKNVPKMTGCYVVTALQRQYVRVDKEHRTDIEKMKVGVWCPILPNHFFVARRQGHVFITKNTPVPVQENMYAHLVDSMKHTGTNPLTADPSQMDTLRRDWLDRDSPAQFPEHSRQHFHRLENVLRLKNDSKLTNRKQGDISSYMLASGKFKHMSKYRDIHGHLMDILSRHKADGRNAAGEMMRHKHQAGLWDAKRRTALASGKEDPGAYPHGSSFPGLAPKTSRYALGMMGAGNSVVPDTHFVRYLFGLDKGKDAQSIKHLKNLLWNPQNTQALEGLDRYFAKHHDGVEHMVNHPKWGQTFENREDAVFPAFWKTWMGIVPHEKARGLTSGGFNEMTDHKPFWEAVAPHLQKSEDHDLPMRTAIQHADWAQQYGAMAAQQLYFRYLLPQLLDAGLKRKVGELVQKFDSLSVDLRSLEKAEAQEGRPIVRFQDKDIRPGAASVNGVDYHLLSASPSEFIGIPRHLGHTIGNHKPEDLLRIPRNHNEMMVYGYPEDLTEKNVVDIEKHGVGEYNHHPETRALVHGLDFGAPQQPVNDPSTYVKGKFWIKNAEGKRVLMKPSPEDDGNFTEARREGLYHNLAKDFFGMGQYLPRVGVVRHPRTGQEFAAIEEAAGTHYNWARSGDPERHKHLKALGDAGELDKMSLMNMVTGNSDRHNYNWLMPEDGKLKLIDHGLAFDYPGTSKPSYMSWYHGTNGDDFGDDEDKGHLLHPAARGWAMGLRPEELDQQMRRHGVPESSIGEAVGRLKALHQHLKLNPATSAYAAYSHPQIISAAGADVGVQVKNPWTSGSGAVTLSDGEQL